MTIYLRTRTVYKVGFYFPILQLFVSITIDVPCGCRGKLVVGEMLCGMHNLFNII